MHQSELIVTDIFLIWSFLSPWMEAVTNGDRCPSASGQKLKISVDLFYCGEAGNAFYIHEQYYDRDGGGLRER